MIKNIIQIVSVFLIMLAGFSSTFASTGLNVVLANQNPDPVSPGSFVYVNVKVSNSGDEPIGDSQIEFIENSYFKLASGEDKVQKLGILPSFSNQEGSTSYSIAKYKLLVDSRTPFGENIAKFRVTTPTKQVEYEFDILVQDAKPTLQVESFSVDNLGPGETKTLKVGLTNGNSVSLKDFVLTLDLDSVEDKVLSVKGSNKVVLDALAAGETTEAVFEITSSPSASSKPYLLPVEIAYEDSLGNSFTETVTGSVQVYSEPFVILELDSQSTLSSGKNKISLAIANPGTSSVKGTQVEILEGDNYKVLEGSFNYVGDLNPDDFQTIQTELFVKESKATSVKVKLTYLDSYNQKSESVLELPLNIFTADELKEFGVGTQESSGSSGVTIFLVILGVVAFFVGRKLGYKKGKGKRA